MKNFTSTCLRIQEILREELQIDPPAIDDELIESGLLDSMMFVSVIMRLEEEFDTKFDIKNLTLSDFSTITRISKFVATAVGRHAA